MFLVQDRLKDINELNSKIFALNNQHSLEIKRLPSSTTKSSDYKKRILCCYSAQLGLKIPRVRIGTQQRTKNYVALGQTLTNLTRVSRVLKRDKWSMSGGKLKWSKFCL